MFCGPHHPGMQADEGRQQSTGRSGLTAQNPTGSVEWWPALGMTPWVCNECSCTGPHMQKGLCTWNLMQCGYSLEILNFISEVVSFKQRPMGQWSRCRGLGTSASLFPVVGGLLPTPYPAQGLLLLFAQQGPGCRCREGWGWACSLCAEWWGWGCGYL